MPENEYIFHDNRRVQVGESFTPFTEYPDYVVTLVRVGSTHLVLRDRTGEFVRPIRDVPKPVMELVNCVVTYQCPVCFTEVTFTNNYHPDDDPPRHEECKGPSGVTPWT
ncbi:hypothetical protein [Streptomyces sp. NPDC015131]|uniref:hypothetical protein n=1 Tax=Streptomyces sp. NPDC015131 TaxID=3364941 RepID=UPI0036F8570C